MLKKRGGKTSKEMYRDRYDKRNRDYFDGNGT